MTCRGRREVVRLAALLALVLVPAGCGGTGPGVRGHAGSHERGPAGHLVPAGGERLLWRVGETFTGVVSFHQRDQGAAADEIRFTARERFRVVRVTAGVAGVRISVTGWRWRRNTSQLLTGALPPPATFGVDAKGEIVSGVDWPLPSPPPLPGLDVFAAPRAPAAGWQRTDGAGVDLAYRAVGTSSPGAATLSWSVARPQFTRSGDPITIRGRARVMVASHYLRRGRTLALRSTQERASFERTTESAGGTTAETGFIVQTTIFSYP